MTVIVRRFCELLFINSVISVFITLLSIAGILNTNNEILFALLIGFFVFIVLNVRMLRQCYYDLRSNLKFYFSNIFAYLLFAAFGFLVYYFSSNELYTSLFAIMKFAKYSKIKLDPLYSALIFHGVGLLTVIFSPVGMDWIFLYDEDGEEE